MTFEEYKNSYWAQYLKFEEELAESLYYVEPCLLHKAVYSHAFQHQILMIGSELDNIFREMSGHTGRSDIGVYANYVLVEYPSIINQTVTMRNSDNISLCPFSGWNIQQPSASLLCWNNYNMIKHDRIAHFQQASLENTVNILAAAFIIEMYRFDELYKNDLAGYTNIPEEKSKLFILDEWQQHLKPSNIVAEYPTFDDDEGERLL